MRSVDDTLRLLLPLACVPYHRLLRACAPDTCAGNKLDFDAFLAEREEQREIAEGIKSRARARFHLEQHPTLRTNDDRNVEHALSELAPSSPYDASPYDASPYDASQPCSPHASPLAAWGDESWQDDADTSAGRARVKKNAIRAAHTARLGLEMRQASIPHQQ